MTSLPSAEEAGQLLSARFRLPLAGRSWRGQAGGWRGAGAGSSIEFREHRNYQAGDDLRHLDWSATARSGQPMLRVYREEVRPSVDLLIDGSGSLALEADKELLSRTLAEWVWQACRADGVSLVVWRLSEGGCSMIPLEAFSSRDLKFSGRAMGYQAASLRGGSMRVVISDLLFPGEPRAWLSPLLQGAGGCLLLCPWSQAEAEPDWSGNMDLEDCEAPGTARVLVDDRVMEDYRAAYRRHVALWQESCSGLGIHLLRLRAGEDPGGTFSAAISQGAVAPCK
ncbi:MAG: hypothetical protein RL095_1867 [Verrucomicrobiota bacterium]|jgi:uncharacterized protein (DUF58 family)